MTTFAVVHEAHDRLWASFYLNIFHIDMKRILISILCIISMTSVIMADEKEDLIDSYLLQANYSYLSGDISEARANYDNAIQLYRNIHNNISRDTIYAQYVAALGRLCYMLKDYNAAISAASEAAKIYKTVYNPNHLRYAQQLNDLATFNSDSGNYQQAITYASEATSIMKSILGPEDPYYAFSLANLAFYYQKSGMYEYAVNYYTEYKNRIEVIFSKNSVYYIAALSNLADNYSSLNDFAQAIKLLNEAIEINRLLSEGVTDYEYASIVARLARYYSLNNDFNHALEFGIKANELIQGTDSIESLDHAVIANELGNYQAHLGHYIEAIQSGTESISIFEKLHKTNNLDYAMALNNLAAYFAHISNYQEGLKLGLKALDIRTRLSDTESIECAMTLANLANCNAHIGNHNEAIQFGLRAKEIFDKTQNTNNPYYTTLLSNIANYYAYNNEYKKAIQFGERTAQLKKSRLGSQNQDYAISLSNLSTYHFYNNNFNKAIQLGSEALEITKQTLGVNNSQYMTLLSNLAYYYAYNADFIKSCPLAREYITIVRNDVLHTFSGLTSNERLNYWVQHSTKLNYLMPGVLIHSKAPDAPSILYDNTALFSKGLLLLTEQEMTKLILESGDVKAQQMYSELHQNRQVLNAQYSKPITERLIDCDSLERVSSLLERQLVSRTKEFGDYTRNLNITWKDVQSKLNDSDIAIEFIIYPELDNTYAYAALTVCKNDTAPVLTPLFSGWELRLFAGDENTYLNLLVDDLIWGALASRLEDKSNVYFSATGMLHNIGIEYLPSMEGKDCYRLSSTRELVTHKQRDVSKSAALFGGIDYNATYASLKSAVLSEPSIIDYAESPVSPQSCGFSLGIIRSLRDSIAPLPFSSKEVLAISSLLKTENIKIKKCDPIISGSQATEESFKALSGQRKSLIHISTHGFYFNEEEAENKSEHIRMMLMGDDRASHIEDQSLQRCGLCFAGANQVITGKGLPAYGQDDGILNALEIAQTDLRGLDLVVLSACQTALGDVVNGEGVFGLQRGFKKAGANSILMSLWEVDDEVTSKFMIEFYRQWTSGKSKMEALKKAQSVIMQQYPDPQYWAAFILLDALD